VKFSEIVENLEAESIEARCVAVDENGRVLIWNGKASTAPAAETAPQPPQSPAGYTPPHLAERILAERAAMEARGAVMVNARPSPPCSPISKD
jgi:hypothetical protein